VISEDRGAIQPEVFLALSRRLAGLVDGQSYLARRQELSYQGQFGGEAIELRALAWEGGGIRWARLVSIQGDRGTFALNLCLFPRSDAPLPLWSSEYLALRGRLHLFILDALALDEALPAWTQGHLARVNEIVQPAGRAEIPPWAQVAMSPGCLFVRPPRPMPAIDAVHEGYAAGLAEMLQLAGSPPPDGVSERVAVARRAAENLYHAAMSENDPAVHYLRRAFGEALAERLTRETLFPPCP
jgi:hypothetical protein